MPRPRWSPANAGFELSRFFGVKRVAKARQGAQKNNTLIKTTSSNTITYANNSGTNKQDDGFNYDFVGNILMTPQGLEPKNFENNCTIPKTKSLRFGRLLFL